MSTNKHKHHKYNSTDGKESDFEKLNQLANKLDTICRRRLPDGVIRKGLLAGHEPELRQEALLMALGGFLAGNPDYITADRNSDSNRVLSAMEKCIAMTLRHCKARLARHLSRQNAHSSELTEFNGGHCVHPVDLPPSDWALDVKSSVALTAVRQAVGNGLITRGTGVIISLLCKEGTTVREVAGTLRVTPNAIYQRVARVRAILPEIIDTIEVL